MSQGPLDRTRFERIEAYVLDRMSVAERQLFEQEISADAGLNQELELQRENTRAVELGGVERQLRQLAKEHAEPAVQRMNWIPLLKVAAAIAVVLSVAVWFLAQPTASEQLFAEYHVSDPGLPVPMSATDKHVFHDAMVDFKMADYEKAADKWQLQLASLPGNDTLRYYIACAKLEAGDPATAIGLYEGLVQEGSSTFLHKAEWYLVLAYVKAGNGAAVLQFEPAADSPYAERIAEIKERMRPS